MRPLLSFLYGISGIVTFVGFFPTIKDLWRRQPSANLTTYVIWFTTTFVTFLYAVFIVSNLLFAMVISLQLIACAVIAVLRMRLGREVARKN